MLLTSITVMSFVFFSMVYQTMGNCLVSGCGSGLCCSAYGFCGTGFDYCGGATASAGGSGCRAYGCPAGQCCSQFGYCGTSVEHCGGSSSGTGYAGGSSGYGTCGAAGCPAGSCCSSFGFCGNTATHCGGSGVSYSNCGAHGCGAGLCCSKHGYCGSTAAHCSLARFLSKKAPASIEGVFESQARYYNETMASYEYSTCGISRARSLDENNQKIYIAALNEAQFDPYTKDGIPSMNPICEKKAIVKGTKGEILIRFIDRCRGCQQGEIALSYDGFLVVAGELGNGYTDITWHFI